MLKVDNIITPDKFISLGQNCLSERRNCGVQLTSQKNIFFVKTDLLDQFFYNYLPNINYNFVLITHDADAPISERYLPILNHPNLIKWFGMNCHIIHDKLQPIPIGIANECWPHGDKHSLLEIANREFNKSGLIYSNFTEGTNLTERQSVNSIIRGLKGILVDTTKRNYQDYLTEVKKHKFIISPPGNSVDCHRIWESIYIGTVPIVLKSIPMVYFKDCPILFIDKWEDLFNMDLKEKYSTIIQRSNKKALFSFYRQLILDTSKV